MIQSVRVDTCSLACNEDHEKSLQPSNWVDGSNEWVLFTMGQLWHMSINWLINLKFEIFNKYILEDSISSFLKICSLEKTILENFNLFENNIINVKVVKLGFFLFKFVK
jgi:hypothetical protein